MTNLSDSHQDGHRAGAKTKAVTNIGKSLHGKKKNEALTNLGNSHQDVHRAGVKTKAETNIRSYRNVKTSCQPNAEFVYNPLKKGLVNSSKCILYIVECNGILNMLVPSSCSLVSSENQTTSKLLDSG